MSKLSEKYASKISQKEQKAIEKAMAEQKEKQNSFREVPEGTYAVIVDKLEVAETSWGDDQISIWFKITEGEYKNNHIFYNGMFNENFSNGINATGILLADMLDDDEMTSSAIAVLLSHHDKKGGMDEIEDFIADMTEEIEDLSYDLDYQISLSKKINERTGKPYVNKTYTISGVYDR